MGSPIGIANGPHDEGRARHRAVSILGVVFLVACTGEIGPGGSTAAGDPAPAPGVSGTRGDGPTSTPSPEPSGSKEDPFALDRSQPALLPFDARLRRVATSLGMDVTDSAFDTLRRHRVELGDSDYANGIGGDGLWTAGRISLWIKYLRPVCRSDAARAALPNLDDAAATEALGSLLERAWGRVPSADEIGEIQAEVAAVPVGDPEARRAALCLAVFASAEVVLR